MEALETKKLTDEQIETVKNEIYKKLSNSKNEEEFGFSYFSFGMIENGVEVCFDIENEKCIDFSFGIHGVDGSEEYTLEESQKSEILEYFEAKRDELYSDFINADDPWEDQRLLGYY